MEKNINELVENTFSCCHGQDNCAQTVLKVMMEYYNEPNEIWHKISAPFGGGLVSTRNSVCGALSGGLMVIGLKEEEKKIKEAGQALLGFVEEKYGNINCNEILNIDFDNQDQVTKEKASKGKSICTPLVKDICLWLASRYKE